MVFFHQRNSVQLQHPAVSNRPVPWPSRALPSSLALPPASMAQQSRLDGTQETVAFGDGLARGLLFIKSDDEPLADFMTVRYSNQKRAQLRPRPGKGGATSYQLRQYAEATLGGGSLRKIVKLPEGEDENEWLAVNSTYFPQCCCFVSPRYKTE
jgi:hypothetical protein